MGTVWLAQQQEPLKRLVAVKLIKAGMDSKAVRARFEAERQALALMDHANIARVLDAGTTKGEPGGVSPGRPYFVMDLVRGVPITRYCDEHHLTPRQRLELFIPVCQAVQHAHQKGIIHRDLKPSNVLVALYDGKPVPKVIDFGVAKAAGQSLTEKTLVTSFGAIVGTLEYMSPEQAEINQLDIDTRSDIYSLGVLLYELLAGSPPFTRKDLEKGGMLEMLRVIREQEPAKPSTKLSTAEGLPTLAANRGTEPARLTKLVRGELDWIVLKALEKDRNRRYETANGFAMDVQRYLADEPVQACPPSASYRLKKFARRNKGGLAVAALVLFFLVILGSGVGWAVRDRSAREAEAARQQVERQAKAAGQVESILAEVDRLEAEQKWPEALAAARRAEAIVAGGDTDEATEGRVRQRLKDLGFINRLEQVRLLKSAWVKQSFDYATWNREYARTFREYGVDVDELAVETSVERLKARPTLVLPVAAALDDWGDARRAVAGSDAARRKRLVAVARGIDPDPLRDLLRSRWGRLVSEVQTELRRLVESIDIRKQHPETIINLAHHLHRTKDADTALRLLRDAQRVHPGDFWLNYYLGYRLADRQDYEGAVRFYTAAVSIRPRATAALNDLGNVLLDHQRPDEAIAIYRRAIELDPNFAYAHNGLGNALRGQKKPDEAITHYRKAIALDPNIATAHYNLGAALSDQNRLDEAIAAYREAIALDPKSFDAYRSLGTALGRQKKLSEAIKCFHKALELNPKSAAAHTCLGVALYGQKKLDEAITHYRKALELDPKAADAHYNLGVALYDLKKLDEAICHFRTVIQLAPKDASAHYNLGNALFAQKKLDEAIVHYRKVLELNPKAADARRNLGNALYQLGLALRQQGKLDDAIAAFHKAIALRPDYAEAYYNLGHALTAQRKLDEAIAAYRKAIALKPGYAQAHCNLGQILLERGQFAQALEFLQKGHELGRRQPGWSNPSGRWVKDCERLLALDKRLPDVLAGQAASPAEQLSLADLCLRYKKRYADAALLYGKAFAVEPSLVKSPYNADGYNAARAAVLAAGGQGIGADKLDATAKARLRGQALDWLRAVLATRGKLLADHPAAAGPVQKALQHWLDTPDLSGVRDAKELDALPREEREVWQKLWRDVRDLMTRAGKK
ncbi:MAG: tetratricopeptide repeat protein [Gemmataceae bacterium]|nr:tetratricopeptide repeat protein [Gemmataceae bacterium]